MRVVGRDLDGVDRDHADARIFQIANQLGHIALDLVGDAEATVGNGSFVFHTDSLNTKPAFFWKAGLGVRSQIRLTAFVPLP